MPFRESAPKYNWVINCDGTIAEPTIITVSDTEPTDPADGDVWINTTP